VKFYPATRSVLDINKGAPEYESSGAQSIFETIHWTELLELLLASLNENEKRGNLQLNFGFSSSHGHQSRQGHVVVDHFGVAVPAVHTGTDNPLILVTLIACSKLAALPALGVYWATQVSIDPDLTDRHRVFASTLTPPPRDPSFGELLSVVANRLSDKLGQVQPDTMLGVQRHTDNMNAGKPISQVLFAQSVVKDPKTGE
jgi:hypothetical protein